MDEGDDVPQRLPGRLLGGDAVLGAPEDVGVGDRGVEGGDELLPGPQRAGIVAADLGAGTAGALTWIFAGAQAATLQLTDTCRLDLTGAGAVGPQRLSVSRGAWPGCAEATLRCHRHLRLAAT